MELDTKQKVLVAFYMEYQKDIPEMEKNIKPTTLGIDHKSFSIALEKLQSEGYIKDVVLQHGGNEPWAIMVWQDNAKLTRLGINYVESKLEIGPTLTGIEKVKETGKRLAEWGQEQFKDFSAKIIAEMASKAMGQQKTSKKRACGLFFIKRDSLSVGEIWNYKGGGIIK